MIFSQSIWSSVGVIFLFLCIFHVLIRVKVISFGANLWDLPLSLKLFFSLFHDVRSYVYCCNLSLSPLLACSRVTNSVRIWTGEITSLFCFGGGSLNDLWCFDSYSGNFYHRDFFRILRLWLYFLWSLTHSMIFGILWIFSIFSYLPHDRIRFNPCLKDFSEQIDSSTPNSHLIYR